MRKFTKYEIKQKISHRYINVKFSREAMKECVILVLRIMIWDVTLFGGVNR
jgi:hypothetical protein